MSDLIDRGAFILEQCHNCDGCCELVECDCLNCTSEHRCEMIADLLAQQTIDAVEVEHGEWIMFERPNGGYYKGCSLCTYPMPTDMELDYLCEEDNRYCYNCGAKMEVEHESD